MAHGLKPAVNCSEFMPSGYDPPFRKDQADGYGGVLIAIKTGLTAEQLMILTLCELVAVKLNTSNTPLIVVGIYSTTDNNTDSMCDAISSIARKFPNTPMDNRRHKPPGCPVENKHCIETSVSKTNVTCSNEMSRMSKKTIMEISQTQPKLLDAEHA